jgi:hypothetical protein
MTLPFAAYHLMSALPKVFSHADKENMVLAVSIVITAYGAAKFTYIVASMLIQTFDKLKRPSSFFNLDKKALREA